MILDLIMTITPNSDEAAAASRSSGGTGDETVLDLVLVFAPCNSQRDGNRDRDQKRVVPSAHCFASAPNCASTMTACPAQPLQAKRIYC